MADFKSFNERASRKPKQESIQTDRIKFNENFKIEPGREAQEQVDKILYIIELYGKDFFKNKKILYLGCYNGTLPNYFSELGSNVLCVEGRQENIDRIKLTFPNLNIIKDDLDVKTWKYGSFDFIFNFNMINHLYRYLDDHIINCLNNCDTLILDSQVLNTSENIYTIEREFGIDNSISEFAKKISASYIESILKYNNIYYLRKDVVELNSSKYKYNWDVSDPDSPDLIRKRFWICFPMNKRKFSKMDNLSIIIQGKYNSNFTYVYDKYKKISDTVLLSVWREDAYENLPIDIDMIELDSKLYDFQIKNGNLHNPQNLYRQCITTYEALKKIKTKYVLKVRTDEFYNNIDHIYGKLMENDSKIITSNLFFRRDIKYKFHISDKVIMCKTSILRNAFKYLIKKIKSNDLKIGEFELSKTVPESAITCAILYSLNKKIRVGISKKIMIQNFDCVDVNKLYPFNCQYNGAKLKYNFPVDTEKINIIKNMEDL